MLHMRQGNFRPVVYILSNQPLGMLYVGVSSDLIKRIWLHQTDILEGHSQRHQLHRLVYYECFAIMRDAIAREKQLKRWRRRWKIQLIESQNPDWIDLYPELLAGRLRY